MKLKQIKLSGFKSFVDPTSISFPSNLSAVVGPNGCGKSNVIDAVKWVMGESSARNLRSESMADVVFKGSASRKPVSRASVELLFENHDGRIGGEYSEYSEISVRRTLELDGQSNYYLNSTSCRRRDITDVFLGTGLGSRSYAIIEQDMISRLVSSKPEEMRSYIEEVAGISRYLERRKETESRIKRTRENLARLDDLRDEVDRILLKLKQQAKAAEKYTELRHQEKITKGLVGAFKWQNIKGKLLLHEEYIRDHQIKMEEVNTVKVSSDTEILKLRSQNIELQTQMDKIQQKFYEAGAEILRKEQELNAQKEQNKQINLEIDQITESLKAKSDESKILSIEKDNLLVSMEAMTPEIEKLGSDDTEDHLRSEGPKELLLEWDELLSKLNDLISKSLIINATFEKGLNEELKASDINSLKKEVNSVSEELSALKSVPIHLIEKTNSLLRKSSEDNKAQKENILYKTKEFANMQAKLATANTNLHFLNTDIKNLSSKLDTLESTMQKLSAPVESIKQQLNLKLEERLTVEKSLSKVRKDIDMNHDFIRSMERTKTEREQEADNYRQKLEDLRLELQAYKIEQETIKKNINEQELDVGDLLTMLKEDSSEESLNSDLERIERSIARLGAINLAAVEESSQEEQRKDSLDQQYAELIKALEMLEEAIKKIDKETKTTFKDTFDLLNQHLSKIFPKLFGGGHAQLTMLGDDLLSSGVGIIASPPGKRNSSVSQLSGGEKALTAIALVFSFFELNPSPFCMLDEVDAPLDDLNTMRFISLVEDMAKKVQFIYITHNKISMEKSDHLIGVTMQEPGVSKLVSVDIEEADKIISPG